RPLPALPLDRAARAEQRRRPDAHQPGPERHVQQRAGLAPGVDHEEGDRREDDRLQHRDEHEEEGVGEALQVEEPADPQQPERHGPTLSVSVRPGSTDNRRLPHRPVRLRQYHLPRAKPPNASRPISAMMMPIHRLQTIATTMPTITMIPPRPMPKAPRSVVPFVMSRPSGRMRCRLVTQNRHRQTAVARSSKAARPGYMSRELERRSAVSE